MAKATRHFKDSVWVAEEVLTSPKNIKKPVTAEMIKKLFQLRSLLSPEVSLQCRETTLVNIRVCQSVKAAMKPASLCFKKVLGHLKQFY